MEYPEFRDRFWNIARLLARNRSHPLAPLPTHYPFNPFVLDCLGYQPNTQINPHAMTTQYLYPNLILNGFFDMAAKRGSKKAQPSWAVEFVHVTLNKDEKKRFQAWFEASGETLTQTIFETLQDEYKISMSYDMDNDCAIATIVGKDDSLNPKKCFSMRGDTWIKALSAVAWVHTVLFKSGVWEGGNDIDIL